MTRQESLHVSSARWLPHQDIPGRMEAGSLQRDSRKSAPSGSGETIDDGRMTGKLW